MKSSPHPTPLTSRHFFGALALLAVAGCLSLWFISATSNRLPRQLEAAAQRGEIEPGTFWVTNQSGTVAAVHYWRPTGSNAQDIVFEPHGDRILVRAVPQTNSGS